MTITALENNLIHRVNVGDMLTRSADRFPNALAVADEHRRLTYTDFNHAVNILANSLLGLGLSRGDSVALASKNSIEFLQTYFACAKTGLICVPINLGWTAPEVAHVLRDSGARAIIVHEESEALVAPALPCQSHMTDVIVIGLPSQAYGDIEPRAFASLIDQQDSTEPECLVEDRDTLTLLYTSGTTSAPKGVSGHHLAVYMESMAMAIEGRFRSDDRFAAMLPMSHTAQLNCHCTTALLLGAAIHIRPGFDAGALLDLIEAERITQIFGLPMMYGVMLDHPSIDDRDLSSLRRALYAMAPMPRNLLERCLEVFDCDFYLLFGQTEMSPATTIFHPEHQLSHHGSVGTPVVTTRVGIMDLDGGLLPAGEEGEIVYRSPQVMTDYHGDEEATREAFLHGWFHSGDNGYFDDDGILWFTDRRKDVIKTGGENVASLEVEKALLAAEPGIAEVAVVGLPHKRWSEAITAFVVPRQGQELDAETIQSRVRDHLDPYKIPKDVIVVEDLPRTSTGKIRKNLVRDAHLNHFE
ncbi:AMP-dependent synthetase [Dietzia maris]|jgi:acyl-CoA synthetase (AMP-forming)/AMP-acid ligase II|uniref:AMP-dependent synthetase n=1 Tax=Dietzia maris TaxID=37915 RepID=A0A365P9E4_9ACTN|nr:MULTISPECIES: AMP-binding protein [unclassified Dietzia]MDX2358692.1 AMP-binding protein [Dietzia sp. PP-33]RBA33779.1 AMP-dependent synthetase [Dietzia maris]